MKNTFLVFLLIVGLSLTAQEKKVPLKSQIVDASCGQCQFGIEGHGCELAIRIDGKSYFVDGTSIDSHGDAHAKNGFCEAVRKAEVTGRIIKNRYKSTSFKLLPEEHKAAK